MTHNTQSYITRKREAEAEYLAQIKAALCQAIQHINFADPTPKRRAHEALIPDVNRDVISIGIKYSVKIELCILNVTSSFQH